MEGTTPDRLPPGPPARQGTHRPPARRRPRDLRRGRRLLVRLPPHGSVLRVVRRRVRRAPRRHTCAGSGAASRSRRSGPHRRLTDPAWSRRSDGRLGVRPSAHPGPSTGRVGTVEGCRPDQPRDRHRTCREHRARHGAPVLVLHGTPAAWRARRRWPASCRPTASGSSRSPARVRRDPDHPRARVPRRRGRPLRRPLDDLGVDRTAVLAWSGGGPSAYHFAARHPDRVSALVVTAGLSGHWVPPHASPAEWFVARTRLGGALAAIAGHVVRARSSAPSSRV